jgi:hypothetical protein
MMPMGILGATLQVVEESTSASAVVEVCALNIFSRAAICSDLDEIATSVG